MTTTIRRRALVRPIPEYDPCLMPLAFGSSCCLPGDHLGGCLPSPAGYPPVVTAAVTR